MPDDFLQRVRGSLAALQNAPPSTMGVHLAGVSDEDVTTLAADLESIYETTGRAIEVLQRFVGPDMLTPDSAEDNLIELDTLLDHIRWHWISATATLRQGGDWHLDDPDLESGPADA